jgi:hypothetical protein
MAAKSVQPMTLVWISPPGIHASSGLNPLNSRSDMSVFKMNSPIHKNNGMHASSHEGLIPFVKGGLDVGGRPGGLTGAILVI